MQKYLAEFIGTFFLVLTIGCTLIPGPAGVGEVLAIGSALMVMVYAGGHVSGGHYNPAVTLGVWIRGGFPATDLVPYWLSQVAGALAASAAAGFLVGSPERPAMVPVMAPALGAELLFTFALVYVVLNVATAKATSGNSFYGLAIGMTVLTGAFAVGRISGGAFNPAVAIGVSVMGLLSLSSIWIHVVADFAGAVLAAFAFKATHPNG